MTTVTGDVWTFITEPTNDDGRQVMYDPGDVWNPVTDTWQPDDGSYEFANISAGGGGRWGQQLIVVGHKQIYFGDL